jgi:hypothetical protein
MKSSGMTTGLYRPVAVWLACAVFLGTAMWMFGHRQMGAFDDNIIIDTAWRMFIGQKPYVDFSLPLSPEFYLGAGWAFKLWGVNWSALVRISIAFAVFTFALHSIALSYVVPRRYAIAIGLVCQMLAMMVNSYWWYNSNAAITACLMFSVSLALAVNPTSKLLGIIFCITLTLLSVMKVNIAAMSILVVLVSLWTVRELRTKLLVWVACSAVLVLLLLAVNHLNPIDILKAYLGMAGSRGRPDIRNFLRSKPNEAFISLPLLGACFAAFLVMCRHIYRAPRGRRPPHLGQVVSIASAGMVVGICWILMSTGPSLISGGALVVLSSSSLGLWAVKEKVVDAVAPFALTITVFLSGCATMLGVILFDGLPFAVLLGGAAYTQPYLNVLIGWIALAVVSVAAFVATVAELPPPDWRWTEKVRSWPTVLTIVLVTSGAAAYQVSAERLSVGINGVDLFYSKEPEVAIDLPFFRGFYVSPGLKAVAEELDAVLKQYKARGYDTSNIFFGIRLEFAYATFGIPSPMQIPIWWDPAAAYPPGEEPEIVHRFVAHRFPLCVFYGKNPDFTYLPMIIVEDLERNYRRVSYSEITVYLRNSKP